MASKEEIVAFIAQEFPQSEVVIDAVGDGGATVSLQPGPQHLRPGGTVSGPTLMSMADQALYVALLGDIGIVPLAVTSSLTINFLRKPQPGRRVIAVCRLIKTGRTLAVGEVSLYSEGLREPVAHVVGTYAIPPARAD